MNATEHGQICLIHKLLVAINETSGTRHNFQLEMRRTEAHMVWRDPASGVKKAQPGRDGHSLIDDLPQSMHSKLR